MGVEDECLFSEAAVENASNIRPQPPDRVVETDQDESAGLNQRCDRKKCLPSVISVMQDPVRDNQVHAFRPDAGPEEVHLDEFYALDVVLASEFRAQPQGCRRQVGGIDPRHSCRLEEIAHLTRAATNLEDVHVHWYLSAQHGGEYATLGASHEGFDIVEVVVVGEGRFGIEVLDGACNGLLTALLADVEAEEALLTRIAMPAVRRHELPVSMIERLTAHRADDVRVEGRHLSRRTRYN